MNSALTPKGTAAVRTASRGLFSNTLLLDFVSVAILMAAFFFEVVYKSDALPLQVWDESRNANNALEMARSGHWLVPTYEGFRDHWNTKPPLLIWAGAGFLRLGLPALWALRLPNIIAGFALLSALWSVLRFAIRDRLAAFFGPLLVLSSAYFMGFHVVRTFDYDGPLSLFIFGYVICIWRAFDGPATPGWLWGAGALITAAVLTKGVAALLPLPGCLAFALLSLGKTAKLLRSPHTWLAVAATVLACVGYYVSREAYDPGYLKSVEYNEWGGRFLTANLKHDFNTLYYPIILYLNSMMTVFFLPMPFLPVAGNNARRREMALATLLPASALLIFITIARSKFYVYAAPAIPLLSLASALGVSDCIVWVCSRSTSVIPWAFIAFCIPFPKGVYLVTERNWTRYSDSDDTIIARTDNGDLLKSLHGRSGPYPDLIIDPPMHVDLPTGYYDPIVSFYGTLYRKPVAVAGAASLTVKPGQTLATCDDRIFNSVRKAYAITVVSRSEHCAIFRISKP